MPSEKSRVCPRQAKAVSIEGHPQAAYNGLYTHDTTHEGWPVLKNASGRYCYRYTPGDKWLLGDEPHDTSCDANVIAPEGPLPVGTRTWNCWIDDVGWENHTLMVTLLHTEAEVMTEERTDQGGVRG